MSLTQIYKHYKITPQKLKEILSSYSIKEDIRFVKTVPENWIEILSVETGIPKIDLKNYATPKKEKTNINKENTVSANIESLEEIRNNFQQAEPIKKVHFAYVKFVAADKSHAFIRIILDINTIHEESFRDKTDNDYRITKNCNQLDFDQLILCEIDEKRNNAEIVTTYFDGYLKEINIDRALIKNQFHLLNHNSSPFFVDENSTKYIFITRELFYQRRAISTKSIAVEIDYSNYINQLKKDVESLISEETIENTTIEKLKLLKCNLSEIEIDNLLKIEFDIDLQNDFYFNQEEEFDKFIKKWSLLKLEWLTLSNFNKLTLFTTYFKYWYENQLPLSFWGDQLINACIQYEIKYLAKEQEKSLHQSLLTKHKNLVTETLTDFYETPFLIDSFEIYNALINITKDFLPTELNTFQDRIDESLPDELIFQLWSENKTDKFPKEFSIAAFEKQNKEIQIKILDKLEEDEVITIFPFIKKINDTDCQLKLTKASYTFIDNIFHPVSFDIETNRETIYEIAWNNNKEWIHVNNENEIQKGLEEFKKVILKNKNILVGQNCIAFDCVELEKQDFDFTQNLIWDTFLIEMLLSPEMKNFALNTLHDAKCDAKLTLDLFYNQLLRIIALPEEKYEILELFLEKDICQKIKDLKESINWKWLSNDTLKEGKYTFFRPQPSLNPLVIKVNNKLSEQTERKSIILVPDSFKRSFFSIENISCASKEKDKDFGILDYAKFKSLHNNNKWILACIESIQNYFFNQNVKPYWGNFAPAIRIKIEQEINDIFSILTFYDFDTVIKNDIVIMNTEEFYSISKVFENLDLQLLIISKDLLILNNKTCLKSLEIDELIASNNDNHFWMKFSGGQSFVEITEKDCLKMNITIPEQYDNFWIEKQGFATFKVWGNYNVEKRIEQIEQKNKWYIDFDDNNQNQGKVYFPKVRVDSNANDDFISFNPETVYRTRYWLFQKEIILQINDPNTPTILIIQNQHEIEPLEDYFRSLGFYIPKSEISLGRRLELIHQHSSNKKMIIVSVTKLDKVIEANYSNKINVIIDSIKLFENYFISKNSSLFNKYYNENFNKNKDQSQLDSIEEDEIDNELDTSLNLTKPIFKDLYFHLKLQTPIIKSFSEIVNNNFSDNQLWVIDPRISDFSEISEVWNAKSRTFTIGKNIDFDKELNHIETFISSPKPMKELPFTIEETKSILSSVFLDGEPWYDYQQPFLDDIIPAKTDLLVTLPTGGGKSLLFQAPAIFRSVFTNKLTIVITPLKALMQDQVDGLWNKGFYGCVDYLNSDRGTDAKLIYRAIAGGEISLLFITPERFRSRSFKNALNVRLKTDGGLEYAVFDEAHCVSQWGHEFRPDYFNSAKEITNLKLAANEKFPLLLFSATVSKKIYDDFNTIFS
jgi:hypothetical protein